MEGDTARSDEGRLGCSPLGTQQKRQREKHQRGPDPQHAAERELPDMEPDQQEKPGLGPPVEKEKKSGSLPLEDSPRRAVIPTVLVGGPLVMLAMLFPTAFLICPSILVVILGPALPRLLGASALGG